MHETNNTNNTLIPNTS